MQKQRIVLVVVAAAGAISGLMPWQDFMYLSQSGMDVEQAWIVFALFGVVLAAALIGNLATRLSGPLAAVAALAGAGAVGFGIWKYIQVTNGTLGVGGQLGAAQREAPVANALKRVFEPGMGIYTMIAAGAIVVIAVLVRAPRSKLLRESPYA